MSSKKRVKRPSPARTQAVRNWSSIFGGNGENGSQPNADPPAAGTVNDLVSKSVQLGYRVVDEYIRQGQRAAQRVNERSYDPQVMAGEMQQMATQMGRFASDFAGLWFEIMRMAAPGMAGVAAMPGLTPTRADRPSATDGAAAAPPESAEKVQVKVEVASLRPAEVSLDLSPIGAVGDLSVEDLRAVDPKLPLLRGVAFVSKGGARVLRVRVPNDQPAGIYNALILAKETGKPVGTVSVKISV